MEKVYEFRNGVIHVTLPETCDRDELKKITEDFLRKVIYRRINNGNHSTSEHFRKK